MQRVAVVALAVVLATAPATGVAFAYQPDTSLATPTTDLRAQLLLRWFGETSDARASVAAAAGDPSGESPLRGAALTALARSGSAVEEALHFVGSGSDRLAFDPGAPADGGAFVTGSATASPVRVTTSALDAEAQGGAAFVPPSGFTVGQYQPVAPAATISPEPGSVAFGPSLGGSAAASNDLAAPLQSTVSSVSLPSVVRFGGLRVPARFEGLQSTVNGPALSGSDAGAGADFDLRAGNRNLNFNLSSNYERLINAGTAPFVPGAGSNSLQWQLPDAALTVPNYAELSRISIGAAVSVPVISGLTLNLNYGAGHTSGGYAAPSLNGFGGTDNTYGGRLTFAMPHSANTLSISARALHYQDGLLPAGAASQTNEDVNFTVKF